MKTLRENIDYKKIVTPILQNVEQIDAQQFITTIQNIMETNTQNGWWDQTILTQGHRPNMFDETDGLFLSAKRPLTTTEQQKLKERRKQERDRKTQRKLEQEQKERDIYEKLKRKYEP